MSDGSGADIREGEGGLSDARVGQVGGMLGTNGLFHETEIMTAEENRLASEGLSILGRYRDPMDGISALYAKGREIRAAHQAHRNNRQAINPSENEFLLQRNESADTNLELLGVVIIDGNPETLEFFAIASDDTHSILVTFIAGKEVVAICGNECLPTSARQILRPRYFKERNFSPLATEAHPCTRNGKEAFFLMGGKFKNRFVDKCMWSRIQGGQFLCADLSTGQHDTLFLYQLPNFHEGNELPIDSIVSINQRTSAIRRGRKSDPSKVLSIARLGKILRSRTAVTRKKMIGELEMHARCPKTSAHDRKLQFALGGDVWSLNKTGSMLPCCVQIKRGEYQEKMNNKVVLTWDETPCACDCSMSPGMNRLVSRLKKDKNERYPHDRKQDDQKANRKRKVTRL